MALQNSQTEIMGTFMGREYCIPNYQREYSWESNELEDFWVDLEQTVNDEERKHFFGQVVIHNDEDNSKKKYIIDGQQRSITSCIFMRVLQVFYEELYNESNLEDADYHKADISSKYIGRKGKLHLTLGEVDNEYFRDSIQLGVPENKKEKRKSHKRLKKAYTFFKDKIQNELEECSDYNDQLECLNSFYDAFTERFMVLYMEATKLEEAFVIFETLNARGKDLETADLLKNFIFSKQPKEIISAQKKWNSMLDKLDKSDPTKYIRAFWNSYKKFSRDKDLYRTINNNIKSPRASKELMKNLEEYAQCYHDMDSPDEITEFKDSEVIKSLKYLKMLKASSFYPLIISMKRRAFDEKSIARVLKVIEKYVFRNFTICGKVANTTEVFFADIAVMIYEEQLENDKAIIDKIKEKMVSDDEFKNSFITWQAKKSLKDTVRYIFRNIHRHIDTNMDINIDNSEVHIEHIMPENPKQWDVDEETHENYLWRLGNLCLLDGPTNIEISNKPFKDKKDGYGKSKIEPNKELAKLDKWDKKAIEDRQKRLFKYAKEIWS